MSQGPLFSTSSVLSRPWCLKCHTKKWSRSLFPLSAVRAIRQLVDRATRNEIFKHIGGVSAALLPILLVKGDSGYTLFFLAIAGMAFFGILPVLLIRGRDLCVTRARGSISLQRDEVAMASRALAQLDDVDGDSDTGPGAGTPHAGRPSLDRARRGSVLWSMPQKRKSLSVGLTRTPPPPAALPRAAPSAPMGSSEPVPTSTLFQRDIVIFTLAATMFHVGNAALLPQLGAKINTLGESVTLKIPGVFSMPIDGKNAVSLASVIGQILMIPSAVAAGWLSKRPQVGAKRALLVSYCSLTIRAVVFALCDNPWILLGTQCLDGVGVGGFNVCTVLIMSDLSHGTGRFSLLQGVLATAVGLGTAVSNGISGVMVDQLGFRNMFLVFGGISVFASWLLAQVATEELASVTTEIDARTAKVLAETVCKWKTYRSGDSSPK